MKVKAATKMINLEEYILSVFSPDDRPDAAFKVAREAFEGTKLLPWEG